MLVLKRKKGETVVIGNEIQIQVLDIEGDTVKLGFVAPQNVEILRYELYQNIKEENLHAGKQQVPLSKAKDILDSLLGGNHENESGE